MMHSIRKSKRQFYRYEMITFLLKYTNIRVCVYIYTYLRKRKIHINVSRKVQRFTLYKWNGMGSGESLATFINISIYF